MDDDSTRLTERERRVLAEMELALRRDAPDLERSFRHGPHRRPTSRRFRPTRRMWWIPLLLGTALLGGGIVLGAVPVGVAGFAVVLVSIHGLTAELDAGRVARRVRRWFGIDRPEDDQRT